MLVIQSRPRVSATWGSTAAGCTCYACQQMSHFWDIDELDQSRAKRRNRCYKFVFV